MNMPRPSKPIKQCTCSWCKIQPAGIGYSGGDSGTGEMELGKDYQLADRPPYDNGGVLYAPPPQHNHQQAGLHGRDCPACAHYLDTRTWIPVSKGGEQDGPADVLAASDTDSAGNHRADTQGVVVGAGWCTVCNDYQPLHPKYRHQHCPDCGRLQGCTDQCEDMDCEHCYCYRDGRDG